MGLTYGFYNSLNGDRKYDSTQLSNMFDGLVTDGVYSHIGDAFAVKATTGNIITIGTGRSWFSHTWTLNDALFPITLDQSDVLLNRYDVIVMEIGINNRMNYLKWVKGTPATTAVIPTLTNTNLVKQKPLAIIYRKAGSTSIVQADITNKIGTADCPFSTAILQSVSIDNMIAQWEDQWNTWLAGNKGEFDTWFNQMKGQLTTDAAGKLTVQANKIDSTIGSDYIVSTPSPITTSGLNLVIPAGFQYVCAEGFNADGSVKAVVMTIAVTLNILNLAASSGHTCFLRSDTQLEVAAGGCYRIVGTLAELPTTIPDLYNRLYYVTDHARYYKTSGSTTANWQPVDVCKIGYAKTNATQITEWAPEPTMIMSDLNKRVGDVRALVTTNKTSLVEASNEVSEAYRSGWSRLQEFDMFSYVSAAAPNFVVKTYDISDNSYLDLSNRLSVGMKIRLIQAGVTKYFFIVAISGDQITLYGGTDYVLTNAAIDYNSIYFSVVKSPHGFPMNPNKWSVTTMVPTDITVSVVGNVWKDTGVALSLPVGDWNISAKYAVGAINIGSMYGAVVWTCFYSSPSSEIPLADSVSSDTTTDSSCGGTSTIFDTVRLEVPTVFRWYVKCMVNTTTVYLTRSGGPNIFKAVCAYL